MYAVKTVGLVKINLRITIHAAELPLSHSFWNALINFAKQEKATSLILEVLGQKETDIPHIENGTHRQKAKVYVLDLRKPNSISSNHRRNIKKAKKNGVYRIEQPLSEAIESHLLVSQESGARRQTRGEHVAHLPERQRLIELFSGTRPAKIAQAAMNGKVVSSMLIVFLDNYAFFNSAGSSPDGMSIGASHYLMSEVIDELRAQGIKAFNLGLGTTSRSGLAQYKAGFGADEYFFETISVDTSSFPRKVAIKASEALQLFRN
ncbi:MAG: GNAT family N-acetyltransferase [Nitrospirales bacterium]|nr:GNAT family N-acetyltransferase [Nitrospira sp.]MDR4501913.1 GNAT family N-acetyltransferase [Nitrospirales bacterium]